jgi:hypothetical protein
MFLAVINQSTRFTDQSARRAVEACASQLKMHVAPAWDMVPASVVLYPFEDAAPEGADLLVILDDADQADTLGYHDVTPRGNPYARAFAGPVYDNGGSGLHGSLSVSATISHEVCEWFGDRFVNLWADNGQGTKYAVELCDPVQQDAYEVGGVAVSNFVTKRYFDHRAPEESKFDHMGKLTGPFTMTPGGCVMIQRSGTVRHHYGRHFPDWRKTLKKHPAARTARRMRQGSE